MNFTKRIAIREVTEIKKSHLVMATGMIIQKLIQDYADLLKDIIHFSVMSYIGLREYENKKNITILEEAIDNLEKILVKNSGYEINSNGQKEHTFKNVLPGEIMFNAYVSDEFFNKKKDIFKNNVIRFLVEKGVADKVVQSNKKVIYRVNSKNLIELLPEKLRKTFVEKGNIVFSYKNLEALLYYLKQVIHINTEKEVVRISRYLTSSFGNNNYKYNVRAHLEDLYCSLSKKTSFDRKTKQFENIDDKKSAYIKDCVEQAHELLKHLLIDTRSLPSRSRNFQQPFLINLDKKGLTEDQAKETLSVLGYLARKVFSGEIEIKSTKDLLEISNNMINYFILEFTRKIHEKVLVWTMPIKTAEQVNVEEDEMLDMKIARKLRLPEFDGERIARFKMFINFWHRLFKHKASH
jgi:hypothetical protein